MPLGSFITQPAGAVFSFFSELFGYNRENFQYDRRQRQIAEYQIAELRLEQAGLWRNDVRIATTLTPKKLEAYLLVTALELTFCGMALCKGRAAPGAPTWLVDCLILSVTTGMAYLFLALWYGMQAFVSSQAYKIRILTQMLRLPVPTWQAMEASRTYSSSFEHLSLRQMFRTPLVRGPQEALLPVNETTSTHGAQPNLPASDPWGMERRGENIPELRPDVNAISKMTEQKHVWLAREAFKHYQMYDAFCRICLHMGTSSLATFFCYFCCAHVALELASPVAAWVGVIGFTSVSVGLLRLDLQLNDWEFCTSVALLFTGPALAAIAVFYNNKYLGVNGPWEWLVVVGLFVNACWYLYFIDLMNVKETLTGGIIPTSFKAVLYIDPWGWAKHTALWAKQTALLRRGCTRANLSVGSHDTSDLPSSQCITTRRAGIPMRPEDTTDSAINAPDVVARGRSGVAGGRLSAMNLPVDGDECRVSFKPTSFAVDGSVNSAETDTEKAMASENAREDRPAVAPVNGFRHMSQFIALAWFVAVADDIWNVARGAGAFIHPAGYGMPANGVANMEIYQSGRRIHTFWHGALEVPRGLACDPTGTMFVTLGVGSDGRRTLLQGRLSEEGMGSADGRSPGRKALLVRRQLPPWARPQRVATRALRFAPAPKCSGLDAERGDLYDLSLHGCGKEGGCAALVLPARSSRLVSCPLTGSTALPAGSVSAPAGELYHAVISATAATIAAAPVAARWRRHPRHAPLRHTPAPSIATTLSRAWLEDRADGVAEEAPLGASEEEEEQQATAETDVVAAGNLDVGGLLIPEEILSLHVAPCVAQAQRTVPSSVARTDRNADAECLVVGTTGRRVVQLATRVTAVSEGSSPTGRWMPRRLLEDNVVEGARPGAFALIGERYLGVLRRGTSSVDVLDLEEGGRHVSSFRLPPNPGGEGTYWSAICAGGGYLYAMGSGVAPDLWRFTPPQVFLDTGSKDRRTSTGGEPVQAPLAPWTLSALWRWMATWAPH